MLPLKFEDNLNTENKEHVWVESAGGSGLTVLLITLR